MGLDISKLSPVLEDNYKSDCDCEMCEKDGKGCSCHSSSSKLHEPHEIKIDKPK